MNLTKNNLPEPTPREIEVLECMANGLAAKEIAERLHMCERTVVNHKEHLKEKWGVHSSNELMRIYITNFLK